MAVRRQPHCEDPHQEPQAPASAFREPGPLPCTREASASPSRGRAPRLSPGYRALGAGEDAKSSGPDLRLEQQPEAGLKEEGGATSAWSQQKHCGLPRATNRASPPPPHPPPLHPRTLPAPLSPTRAENRYEYLETKSSPSRKRWKRRTSHVDLGCLPAGPSPSGAANRAGRGREGGGASAGLRRRGRAARGLDPKSALGPASQEFVFALRLE